MPEIIHFLAINTTKEKLYKAITEQEGLAGWWTEDTTALPEINSIAEFNFGEKDRNKMRVTNLVENKLVEWVCIEGDKEWVGTKFKFEIIPENSICYLRFSHTNWQNYTDFYAMCNYHWGLYMTSLKSYCELGSGTPFPKVDK